jgi:Tol biopolymer transport system component
MKDAALEDISPNRTELLLFRQTDVSGEHGEFWVAPLLGGSAQRLGNLVVQGGAAGWSPDGQQVVYAIDGELHIARRDGTEVRKLATFAGDLDALVARLLPRWYPSSYVCCGNWTPDGKYFVFHAKVNGAINIWALREKGGLFERGTRGPVQLTNGPLAMLWPVPSTDGKRLFVDGYQDRNEFLRYV